MVLREHMCKWVLCGTWWNIKQKEAWDRVRWQTKETNSEIFVGIWKQVLDINAMKLQNGWWRKVCNTTLILLLLNIFNFQKLYVTLLFSHSVVSDSLWPHGLQHTIYPVLCCLLEFAQTHVHWVRDAMQPSYVTYMYIKLWHKDLRPQLKQQIIPSTSEAPYWTPQPPY